MVANCFWDVLRCYVSVIGYTSSASLSALIFRSLLRLVTAGLRVFLAEAGACFAFLPRKVHDVRFCVLPIRGSQEKVCGADLCVSRAFHVFMLRGVGLVGEARRLRLCPAPGNGVATFDAAHRNKYKDNACTAFGYTPCMNSGPTVIGTGRRRLYRLLSVSVRGLVVPCRARDYGVLAVSRTFVRLSTSTHRTVLRRGSTMVAGTEGVYLYMSATSYVPLLLCSTARRTVTTIRAN